MTRPLIAPRSIHPAIAFALALVLLVLPFARSAPQQLRNTEVADEGGARYSLPSLTHRGTLYISASALAKQTGVRCFAEATQQRVEFLAGTHRVKLTADNPFVPVIEHATNAIVRVEQFPSEVLVRQKEFFTPAAPFLQLLSTYAKTRYTLAEEQRPASTRGERTDESVAGARDDARSSERLAPRQIAAEESAGFDVPRATVDARKNGTIVRIHARRPLGKATTEDGDMGTVIVTIPQATVDENEFRQTAIAGDDVRSITATQSGPDARIEIALGPGIEARAVLKDAAGNDLLLTLYRTAEVGRIMSEEEQDKKRSRSRTKNKWSLDCIVIDAGHGGRDPGAIGVSGIKEKNITLGIALKLGALINKHMKGVRVVYTRDDDTFIELDRRGKIANDAEGKLFISIHCNSTEKKPSTASGTEVYLLRPGRTEEAIRVAEFENSVIRLEKDYEKRYQKLTAENFIIINMAQSAYVKYSERIADQFHEQVRAGKKLKSLGVKQAGFYVLVGASMPGVLIETGFLSNPKDEAFLASQSGQNHLADVIFKAIDAYAAEYEKSLQE